MGPAWTYQRVRGLFEHKLGTLERRLPNADWCDFDVNVNADAFRQRRIWPIDVHAARQQTRQFPDPALQVSLHDLLHGRLALFGGKQRAVGWPPDWHFNADDGHRLPASEHFSRIATFGHGDIKNFWEPGRFGLVWLLCRAHFAGHTDDAAELFFGAVRDFAEKNPPFRGPQWMCGQEAALRAVTIAGGWSVFGASASDDDVRNVTRLFVATAQRIAVHLDYALSQKNNHGLSEAMGLLVIGLALPEHTSSSAWIEKGRMTLEREATALVDEDGGFSQQSANYHRVMIHDLVAAVAISQHHGIELPQCRAALDRSAEFLHSMIVRDGRQPRYGHDDGACVLDWTACAYDDFRPALQEASFISGRALPVEPGPWDAGLPWLGCSSPETVQRDDRPCFNRTVFSQAGLAVLRGKDRRGVRQYASMRVPPAIFRPGQVDAMHVDVWIDGFNIAIDPGTYRYNADGDWSTIPLALGKYHNVIGSDGQDLARRVGRFLYIPWPKATVEEESSAGDSERSITGLWGRPIGGIEKWRRTLDVTTDGIVIRDRVRCCPNCLIDLRWQLADGVVIDAPDPVLEPSHFFRWRLPIGVVELDVETDTPEASLVLKHERAGKGAAGWYAPRYGELAPSHRVVAEIQSGPAAEMIVISRFRLLDSNELSI
ncbi:heparinase II/III family protein [Allorhodopirellula solitaria]|nr:heparinase II/III family protein [Allorhodopirellula solitaria]